MAWWRRVDMITDAPVLSRRELVGGVIYNPRMVSLFLGLSAANMLLMSVVFVLGLNVTDAVGQPSGAYPLHLALGLGAGLMVVVAHLSVFMYFMATTRWLEAATSKAGLAVSAVAQPAEANKRRVFPVVMTPIVLTMLAMFAGAGADPTVQPWWPAEVHLAAAVVAWAANLLAHVLEWGRLRAQGALMDLALRTINRP